jgi:hypothetical protein
MTITSTTPIVIKGTSVSSPANDLTLDATVPTSNGSGTMSVAVNPQTFSVVAIPINFSTYAVTKQTNGTIVFSYTWQSSSGNIQDLASCVVGENVSYPGSSPAYAWPAPMVNSTVNPTVLNVAGNNPGPNSSTAGLGDYNYAPKSYIKPYLKSSFPATQILQWACPNYNNENFNRFVPNITIVRSVFLDAGGKWEYQITKSGETNSAILPNQ